MMWQPSQPKINQLGFVLQPSKRCGPAFSLSPQQLSPSRPVLRNPVHGPTPTSCSHTPLISLQLAWAWSFLASPLSSRNSSLSLTLPWASPRWAWFYQAFGPTHSHPPHRLPSFLSLSPDWAYLIVMIFASIQFIVIIVTGVVLRDGL